MLPKKNRLTQKEFEEVFSNGKSTSGQYTHAKYIPSPTKATKISFVVPKNILKSAVERNRLRRKGYAVARHFISRLSSPHHIIFFFNPQSLSANTAVLKEDIRKLLEKTGLLE